QIKENLDMIRYKADRDKQDVFFAARCFSTNRITNIRLQPWILQPAAATGISELPFVFPEFLRNQLCGAFKLLNVMRRLGHGSRNTVGGEDPRHLFGVTPADC